MSVEQPLLVADVCAAARRAFDLPSDQELLLLDQDGRELSDEAALTDIVAHAETVYARVPDTALHDFERRVDQLEHMQIGYLCDQLATSRQEYAEIRAEVATVSCMLEQEQAARASGDSTLRREMEVLLEVRKGHRDEASAQALGFELHEARRQGEELRQALKAQSKALELAEERLKRDLEETRSAMEMEVRCRDQREASLEQTLTDTRKALDEVSLVSSREDTAATADALRPTEPPERSAEIKLLISRCSTHETALEAERLARQQVASELTQQLSIAVESIQEEQALRSSEDSELRRLVEGLRRSFDEVRQRQDEAELQASRTSHNLAKRFEEDVHVRGSETSKLHRLLSEEREARQESNAQAAQRLENCLSKISAEERERRSTIEELSESLAQVRFKLGEQHLPQATTWVREIRQLVDVEREARTAELRSLNLKMDECTSRESEACQVSGNVLTQLRNALAAEQKARTALDGEVRSWFEHEAKAREEGDLSLSGSAQKVGNALEEALRRQEAIDTQLQEGKVASDNLWEGLTKVVEAVKQERISRTESDAQLRDDCCEAIQKEIRGRLESESKVREDIQAEVRARAEGLRAASLAIAACKTELETHTHELRVAPEDPERPGDLDLKILRELNNITVPGTPVTRPVTPAVRGRELSGGADEVLPCSNVRLDAPLRAEGPLVREGNVPLAALLPSWSPGVALGNGSFEPIRRV